LLISFVLDGVGGLHVQRELRAGIRIDEDLHRIAPLEADSSIGGGALGAKNPNSCIVLIYRQARAF
jgi:hypothetical protein